MKLSNHGRVHQLVLERARLMMQRDDSSYDILIRGELQRDDLVQAIVPAIRLELGRRIADIDAQLRRYGVEIDPLTL